MSYRFIIFLSLFISTHAIAGDAVWKDITNSSGQKTRTLTVDTANLLQQLDKTTAAKSTQALPEFSLPLPNGDMIRMESEEYSIMEAGAKASGGFRSWKVKGIDEPGISGVVDISSNGFHAMLVMPGGATVYIDPVDAAKGTHKSFYKADVQSTAKFSCGVLQNEESSAISNLNFAARQVSVTDEESLEIDQKVYRLAMAATGEFSQYHLSRNNDPNNVINNIVARVSFIYERDLGIKLALVGNNSSIVFSDPATDPYANNDSFLLENNTNVLNNVIGSGSYDIGHVVTYYQSALGGVAGLGVACGANKGAGTTGSPSPIASDSFSVDFVAHEIGHQLGATHTFNSVTGSCAGNREPATAFEPGSGSTVMGYAGICAPNNIADNSVPYFHVGSISQIENYTRFPGQTGALCGTTIVSTNTAPNIITIDTEVVVNAGDSFTLTAQVSDPDGDSLTYSWDQFDAGTASNFDVDMGDNALFETGPYETVGADGLTSRTFSGKAVTNRNLNFILVVRDGRGGVTSKETVVQVVNGGAAPVPDDSTGSTDQSSPFTIFTSSGGGGLLNGWLLMFFTFISMLAATRQLRRK